MRRFDWRRFRRKGARKLISKDERLLSGKVGEIKNEIKLGGSIKEVSKEVLPEE